MVKCPYCKEHNDTDGCTGWQSVTCEACNKEFGVHTQIITIVDPRPADKRVEPPDPAPSFPPPDSPFWFDALGHRWVTNSSAILRADAPLPASIDWCEWVVLSPAEQKCAASHITNGISGQRGGRRYGTYYAPILRALSPISGFRFVNAKGEVVAVIMPKRDGTTTGTVDELGNP